MAVTLEPGSEPSAVRRTEGGQIARAAGHAFWNAIPLVWSVALGLITVPLAIQFLGIGHFGLYGLIAILSSPLSLTNAGFAEATIRFVALHTSRGDMPTAARYLRNALFLALAVGVFGWLIIALVGPVLAAKFFNIAPSDEALFGHCLVWSGATWFLNQVSGALMGIAPATRSFGIFAVAQPITATCNAAAGLLLMWLGYGLVGFIAGTTVGALCGVFVWTLVARRLIPGQPLYPRWDRQVWRDVISFGGWRTLSQFGSMLANQSEGALMGAFLLPKALGYYTIATGLEGRAYLLTYKMSESLFPLFSTMEDVAPVQRFDLLLRATRLLTTASCCVLGPLLALANPVLAAWVGIEVASTTAPVLRMLCVAGILGCATNASYFYLLGMGRTRALAALALVTGVVTVIFALLILPRYGLAGAAMAGAAAMIAQQVVLCYWILPGAFGDVYRLRRVLWAYFGPVIPTVILACGLSELNAIARLSLPGVILATPLIVAATGVVIVVILRPFPEGRVFLNDIRRIIVGALCSVGIVIS